MLKHYYLGYASLERTIARHRTHRHAQRWRREHNDLPPAVLLPQAKEPCAQPCAWGSRAGGADQHGEATFAHFDNLLGSGIDRECTLNLDGLIEPSDDLLGLVADFIEEEIWNALRCLPARKVPGSDGFTTDFLQACRPIVKQDFLAVFHQLDALRGRGFHRLNQALLTLLPKQPDAQTLGDYCPISLVHLVGKVAAKILSLRLTPRFDSLVSKNQNAFMPKDACTTLC